MWRVLHGSRRALSDKPSITENGVDTAENELSGVWMWRSLESIGLVWKEGRLQSVTSLTYFLVMVTAVGVGAPKLSCQPTD